MPIYIYRCESCGVQFEKHQSFKDEPLKVCPECNEASLRKVLTPAGIVFKGSGWYATDHKSTSGTRSAAKTDPATPAAESGAATAAAAPASEPAKSESSAPATPAKPAA